MASGPLDPDLRYLSYSTIPFFMGFDCEGTSHTAEESAASIHSEFGLMFAVMAGLTVGCAASIMLVAWLLFQNALVAVPPVMLAGVVAVPLLARHSLQLRRIARAVPLRRRVVIDSALGTVQVWELQVAPRQWVVRTWPLKDCRLGSHEVTIVRPLPAWSGHCVALHTPGAMVMLACSRAADAVAQYANHLPAPLHELPQFAGEPLRGEAPRSSWRRRPRLPEATSGS